MEKSLHTVQTCAKIAKVVALILFIIICFGAFMSLIGIATVSAITSLIHTALENADLSFFGDFAAVGKGENLKSATIGQNGAVPSVKLMQSAGGTQCIKSRTQIKMIGVAENDLGVDIFSQFVHVDGFHASYCAYRHEDGGRDVAVVGMQYASAGFAFGVGSQEVKMHLGGALVAV